MGEVRLPAEQRVLLTPESVEGFWGWVDKSGPCWLWQRVPNGDGYGVVRIGNVQARAHRLAYFLLRGPIPPGLELDHLCRVRHCVNPDHLEPVTRRENLLRGINPFAINKRRTHCIHGHEYTPENTGRHPSGNRQCRACKREQTARSAALRKSKRLAEAQG